MGTKDTQNVFFKARMEAAKYNDKLKSRSGAADELGYSSAKNISDWEMGLAIPSSQNVKRMASLYHAPELERIFCKEMCPLGCNIPDVSEEDTASLERITVRALESLNHISEAKTKLLEIAVDGRVSQEEKASMKEVVETLRDIEAVSISLQCWVAKNVEGGQG